MTKERAAAFLDAQYKMRVSCNSIAVSLELFRSTTREIESRIAQHRRTRNIKEERRCVLLMSVFMYEILDLICSFLRAFRVQGVDELRAMNEQIRREVEPGKLKNPEMAKRIEQTAGRGMQPDELKGSVERIGQRAAALDELSAVWDELMSKTDEMESSIGELDHRIDLLELKRDEAAENIRIMALTQVTSIVSQNVRVVENALQIKLPRLPVITPADIRRYIPLAS